LSLSLTEVLRALRELKNTSSTILSELDKLTNSLASEATDKLRVSIVDSIPAGDEVIGRVKITDGTNVVNTTQVDVATSTLIGIPVAPDISATLSGLYNEFEFTATATENTQTFSPPLKAAVICNDGDVLVFIRLNGSSQEKELYPHTCKVIAFWRLSSISYRAESGTSTLRVEGYW
jgi:hypothetical protein